MMTKIEHSVDVNVPIHVAYSQLARFTEFPRFMEGVQEVRQLDNTHLHWRTQHGTEVHEWDSELTEQIPDRTIAWRNTNGRKNTGRVALEAIEADCTRVKLSMEVEADNEGNEGVYAANNISERNERDLSRFKKFVEQTREMTDTPPGQFVATQKMQSETDTQTPDTQDTQDTNAREAGPAVGPSWLPRLVNLWEEPFYVMRRMSNEIDHFLDNFLHISRDTTPSKSGITGVWTPAIEIARRNDQVIICADLPGIKREDVQINVAHDRVTIEGNRPELATQGEQAFHQTDRSYGHFYREIPLPEEIDSDSAAAFMDEGVLQITLPVVPPDKLVRRLDIQSRPR
jgi:HSP20 family molecular chaperone IbpA